MRRLLSQPIHSFPMNSRSVTRQSMQSCPKRRMKRSMSFSPLLPIGIAPFRKKTENLWECNAFIGYTQHKDIDIEFSELPVGAVHTEHKTVLYRKQRKNHTGYDVKIKNVLGEESLKSSEVGALVDSSRHRVCQLVEAHCLHYTECMEKQRHKLYTCQIHIFFQNALA